MLKKLSIESSEHFALKQKAVEILRSLGFTDDEIDSEFSFGKVDIVGIKKDYSQTIGIECGKTKSSKIQLLERFFDKVIQLPYSSGNHTTIHVIKSPEIRKILLLLKKYSYLAFGITPSTIAKETEIPKTSVRVLLANVLNRGGFVERTAFGHYKITEKGITLLKEV